MGTMWMLTRSENRQCSRVKLFVHLFKMFFVPKAMYCKWWIVCAECQPWRNPKSLRHACTHTFFQPSTHALPRTTGNVASILYPVWHEPRVVSEVSAEHGQDQEETDGLTVNNSALKKKRFLLRLLHKLWRMNCCPPTSLLLLSPPPSRIRD